jgi:hypothetical protein
MSEGLSSVGAQALGLPDGHSYRVRSGLVGGNRLVVAAVSRRRRGLAKSCW